MESFNVLRGREPIKTEGNLKYCAGYIKFLPDRAKIFGIEFSGYNADEDKYDNPQCGFDYYIFCSESAWIKFAKSKGITLEPKIVKEPQNIGNPALFIISSGTYDPEHGTEGHETPAAGEGEEVVEGHIKYPHLIGFQGVRYSHEPRPYSNVDAYINANDVQYPLYLFVEFNGTPEITELDYQLINGK